MPNNKTIDINTARTSQNIDPASLPKASAFYHNGNGGEPPMDNKYVTHEELQQAIDTLNNKIDFATEQIMHQLDNKFAEINKDITETKYIAKSGNEKANWILGILASIVGGIVVAAITKLFT